MANFRWNLEHIIITLVELLKKTHENIKHEKYIRKYNTRTGTRASKISTGLIALHTK